MLKKFVVVDLETTGNLPKKGDRIIQFAAVVIEDGIITERFTSLVNPQKPIPIFIEELTGISDDMVKDAPLFSEIAAKVIDLLDGAYFVAHNILFDLSFLQEELIQSGFEGFYGHVLDTVEMARILYPTSDGYKLSDLAEKENIRHDRPHQADSDAEVTAELFLILLRRLTELPTMTLKQLMNLSGGLKCDLQLYLDDLLTEMGEEKEGLPDSLEIFGNLVLKKASEMEWETEGSGQEFLYPQLENDKIELVKEGFHSFELRTGQFMMMDAVYRAFQDGQHALIEAGTGVGKSLGYLLPAAYYSKKNNQRLVISTHTIQLQEQILTKEIPLLKKILPFNANIVLLKGRNHYLHLAKFAQMLESENDNYDTTLTKMQILVWLTQTETGDKDELNLSSGGELFWNKIKNEHTVFWDDPALKSRDFYSRAIKKAEKADLIITNHSLLLSDLKEGGSIIPDFKYVIIDEAHHLEKTATHFFGFSLDYLSVRMLLGQFGLYEQKQLFYEMEQLLDQITGARENFPHYFELNQLISNIMFEMDELFKLMILFAKTKLGNKRGLNRTKVRFSQKDGMKEGRALIHSAERFAFLLKDLLTAITMRLEFLNKNSILDDYESKMEEIVSFINEVSELRTTVINCFLKDSHEVKWVEIDIRSPQNVTTFMAQPASVAGKLKDLLFQEKKSAVLTSATLTVNQSFDYIIKEMGLDHSATLKISIPSPFEYKNQVQLLIPEDLPEINSVSLDEFVISITEHIISVAEATKGRMLILFTAYDMLKRTYELIKESGFLNDYVLIAQGISSGSRTRLTRNFQRYEKAILLGTSSFWEGVDIPGEDLSCLVIVRLPFSPPDEPLTEAKCQLITQKGGNAFSEYSLPEAILRFKQGFGRLIRTESDRGIILVFDKRIMTTKYGKAFLDSVPSVSIKKGTIDELTAVIRKWL
ncbi:ATP-dependent DNA helicase DinG [Bacillus sp. BRMEA1]|uniref:ATP-dependent DNA helicase DinG n=1 Tax=Neobacillus endophyticus TaxID=2738405 RepID=UPI0015653580|nr:ATP-dependent DNA helicase DinG [Neobacillus endophyticus]NRD80546.1 ATP-dependent DNA helicase DinG [Neobacillus endophyticus]